jgi:Na+/melibiose symporter-like transporter
MKKINKGDIEWTAMTWMTKEREKREKAPTVRMWFSKTRDIAMACSVFSFAMTVRLLI